MGPYILLPEHENSQQQKNHAVQKRQDNAQHAEGDQAPACQFPLEGRAKINHGSPHGRNVTNMQYLPVTSTERSLVAKIAYRMAG
jgi:hypothetical protein